MTPAEAEKPIISRADRPIARYQSELLSSAAIWSSIATALGCRIRRIIAPEAERLDLYSEDMLENQKAGTACGTVPPTSPPRRGTPPRRRFGAALAFLRLSQPAVQGRSPTATRRTSAPDCRPGARTPPACAPADSPSRAWASLPHHALNPLTSAARPSTASSYRRAIALCGVTRRYTGSAGKITNRQAGFIGLIHKTALPPVHPLLRRPGARRR
jgi:hypothetical protein